MDINTEKELIDQFQLNGDLKARDTIIMGNYGLVVNMARKLRYDTQEQKDLIQEGLLGLLVAITKFDTSKGVKFSTYASYHAKSRMTDYLLKNHGTFSHAGKSGEFAKIYFNMGKLYDGQPTTSKIKEFSEEIKVEERHVHRFMTMLPAYVPNIGNKEDDISDDVGDSEDINAEDPFDIVEHNDFILKAEKALAELPDLIEKGLRCKFQEHLRDPNPTMRAIVKEYGCTKQNFNMILNKQLAKLSKSLIGVIKS